MCPVRLQDVRLGEPVGNVQGEPAHIECWRPWKEEHERRQPLTATDPTA